MVRRGRPARPWAVALLGAGIVLFSGCSTNTELQPVPHTASIAIDAPATGPWKVKYALPSPATELVFDRQPDDSRTRDWTPESGFEIVRTGDKERLRRTDDASFAQASVAMQPLYRDLPKDYGPFSPFGDGGLLSYTGRFFACPGECNGDEMWRVSLNASGRSILVDGKIHTDRTSWNDSGQGRNVYVGETRPVETPDFLAVIDNALPERIRTQLADQLPDFMHFFAERLGALPERPMLFVSYDLKHEGGWGRQGGTLPGQVFVHFYGPVWPEKMGELGFAYDLAWHLGHEAGHLYQRQLYADDAEGAWIHEGGAEAFAALALRSKGRATEADAQVAASAKDCTEKLGARSLHTALAAGEFDLAYACGLRINLALDAELRRIAPKSDGLFTVWRRYRERVGDKGGSEEQFLLAIADVGGDATATRVKEMLDQPAPAFTFPETTRTAW